jgi:hypothetical protein
VNLGLIVFYYCERHSCSCEHASITRRSYSYHPPEGFAYVIVLYSSCQGTQPTGQHAPHQTRFIILCYVLVKGNVPTRWQVRAATAHVHTHKASVSGELAIWEMLATRKNLKKNDHRHGSVDLKTRKAITNLSQIIHFTLDAKFTVWPFALRSLRRL